MCAFDYWLKQQEDRAWDNYMPEWLRRRIEAYQELERINWPSREREIIRHDAQKDDYKFQMAHWGLVPFYVKEADFNKAKYRAFNARCETVSSLAHFRAAYRSKRCVLMSTGYGEWADKIEDRKQPVKLTVDGGRPFCYAGLWEEWGPRETPYVSCTMITCEPNELAGEVHSRMPVILDDADIAAWLDPASDPKELLALLAPFPSERMSLQEVTLPPRKKKPLAEV